MPNFCSNTLTLEHKDPDMITRAVEAMVRGDFLNTFVPIPDDAEQFVNNASAAWGTKWDVGGDPDNVEDDYELGDLEVTFNFQSAWSPPIEAYRKLEEQGFAVLAYYWEPGNSFCGEYSNGNNDYYDIDGDSAWVEENIPESIEEEFDIVNTMAMWEEDE